jgi:DNA repair exonuclease SbcCD ATPase subunit
MRRILIATSACLLVAGLVASAQDVKPAQPAQPAQPKAVQPVQPVQPIQPIPPRPTPVTALKMAQLEEEYETIEAHREVKKAVVKAAEIAVNAAETNFTYIKKIGGAAGTPLIEVDRAKMELEAAKAQLEIRIAELKEVEVKVKYAKKRLDDAKAAGVRPVPPIVRPVPVDPKATDPLPNVRLVADEKQVAELKEKLATVKAAIEKRANLVKTAEEALKVAKAEHAKILDVAMRGRVLPGTIEKAAAKVEEAAEALKKQESDLKSLKKEADELQEQLKKLEK